MKQELRQVITAKRGSRRKKVGRFDRRLNLILTHEQFEILELWAKEVTEGNVSLLVRQILFSKGNK